MPPSSRLFRGLLLLMAGLHLSGCATVGSWFRSAGTYAVAAPSDLELRGRGEVHGTLLLTPSLSNVMMEGREPPKVLGLPTRVVVEPLGLSVATDPAGKFVLPHLEPGSYHIAFQDPGGREIWTEFDVAPDQRLEVVVWVQWDGLRTGYMSDGTPPGAMFPGASGYSPISSGSRESSRGGRGGSGGGA